MSFFLVTILLLTALYWGMRRFLLSDPKTLAANLFRLAGILFFLIGTILLVSVRFAFFSLPFFGLGLWLLFGRSKLPRFARHRSQAKGASSSVETAYFSMTLAHQSGELDGVIKQGAFRGCELSSLLETDLQTLYSEVVAQSDDDSLRLLEAYLDSKITGWRENFNLGSRGRHGKTPTSGTISEEEAYEILGLVPGAGVDAIRDAHRRLIMKLHPDRGGSTALAAKINEAKDFLLANHAQAP